MASYDDAGLHRWSRCAGGPAAEYGGALAVDGNGNVTVSGDFTGAVDFGGGDLTAGGDLDAFLASYSPAGAHRWSLAFGGDGTDLSMGLAVDGGGRVTVTGRSDRTVDFGGGPLSSVGKADVFAAAYNEAGAYRWAKRFESVGNEWARAVAVDGSGNVAVVGTFLGTIDLGGSPLTSAEVDDVFVASYTAAGAHRWSLSFGGAGFDNVKDVVVDGDGNVTVTGYFAGAVDFGAGPVTSGGGVDMFVVSYSAAGAYRWARQHGAAGGDMGLALAVDGSGDVTVTGSFTGWAHFGGDVLTSAGNTDVFLASYEADGAHRWSRRYGGAQEDVGLGVAADGSGNVTLTGYFTDTASFGGGDLTSAGGADVFLARYDAAGKHLWSQRFGGDGSDRGQGLAVDGEGAVAVTGGFENSVDFGGGALTSDGSLDVFVASYTADGAHRWSRRFGGPETDAGRAVAVDGEGVVTVTGYFSGTVDLGGGALTSAGSYDVFVASYTAAGAHRWSRGFGSAGLDEGLGVAVGPQPGGRLFVCGRLEDSADLGGGLVPAGLSGFLAALAR